ncbi:MAG: HD-GYP domain-containing protein [Actinomycetota bacterium]
MKWFEPKTAAPSSIWRRIVPCLAGAALALLARPAAVAEPEVAMFWVLLFAGSMQIRVPTTSIQRYGMAVAVGVATPIYFTTSGTVDLASTLFVYGAGLSLGALLLLLRPSRSADVPALTRRLLAMIVYAVIFRVAFENRFVQMIGVGWRAMVPLVLAAAGWLTVEVFLSELERGKRRSHPLHRDLFGDVNVFVSLVATGALAALAYSRLGMWALGVAGVPYLFAHSAFGRFLTIKRTYRQTIRALARIPEVAGLGVDGHADRTAGLAAEVGDDLGLSRAEMDDLEYAALMHDIGRITLTEPAILRVGYTDDDIARWGAEIISQAPYLDRVADHVRQLHQPYRKPGELSDPAISIISKVVRASSSYDHLVAERNLSPLQAVEVLHQGASYDFDPAVVAAMRRVLERRMAFHPSRP